MTGATARLGRYRLAMAEARTWRRALVTGASSGIGEAMARQLGAAGTDVVLVARNEARLEDIAGEIRGRNGVKVDVLVADLADPTQLAAVEARVASTEAPVELVVNNAGYGLNGDFTERSADDHEGMIRTNVVALMRLTHAAVERMRPGSWGGILNVSSVVSFQPGPGSADYAATKAYVTSLTLGLHEELRGSGVHVTCLCPGATRTEFQDRGGYAIDMPSFIWQGPDEVARAGLAGVGVNTALVTPGVHNVALHWSSRLLPGALTRRVAGAVADRTRTSA